MPVIGRNNRHSRFWHANYRLYRITKQIEEHQRHFNPVHIDSDVFWNLVKELWHAQAQLLKVKGGTLDQLTDPNPFELQYGRLGITAYSFNDRVCAACLLKDFLDGFVDKRSIRVLNPIDRPNSIGEICYRPNEL